MVQPCGEDGELPRECMLECASSHSVGRQRKRCTDTVKECLKKRGLDVRQAQIRELRSEERAK